MTQPEHVIAEAAEIAPIEIELRPLARWPESDVAAPRSQARPRRRDGGTWLFWATVGLPVAAATLYLFVLAAPRYASEASYIVRSAGAGAGAGVSSLMQTRGVSRAVDETFAVNEYLASPELVAKLSAQNGLRDILARPEADMFNRYPGPFARDNLDALRRRFEAMLTQTVDEGTGISRLEVVAFRPQDAQSLASALLTYAEDMVNRLNQRAYKDALALSNIFVDQAMTGLKDAEAALSTYRDASGSVDPGGDAASTMKVIQTLSVQLSRTQASILEQEAMAPHSPQSTGLRERVAALRQEIDRLRTKVVGAGPSAASKMGRYEELTLRRELAAKTLENAVLSRDKARENAENQHLYVQVIRAPSLADVARYPRAFVDLGWLIATATMIFWVLSGFLRAAQEHRV